MVPPPIPDRWLNYKPIGEPIKGTRFIAFKVPLTKRVNEMVGDNNTRLDISQLLEQIPNLGLVIDLTFTTRYYDPEQFKDGGVKYVKLMIPGGGTVPQKVHINLFDKHVQDFLDDDSNTGKLIGVHCTHGVNRTGFLICHHMITHLKVQPKDALNDFEIARGHGIEREKYRNTLTRPLQVYIDEKQDNYEADYRSEGRSAEQIDYNRTSNLGKRKYNNRGYGDAPDKRGRNDNVRFDWKRRETESESQVKHKQNTRWTPSSNNRYPDRNSERRNFNNNHHSSQAHVMPSKNSDRHTSRSNFKRPSNNRQYPPDRHNRWRNDDNIRDSSRIDPLPSNDCGSNFSVMDQLYSNNGYSNNRFGWGKSLKTADKKE